MTRTHFEEAANIVRRMRAAGMTDAEVDLVRQKFTELFSAFNPRFDRDRFAAACEGRS